MASEKGIESLVALMEKLLIIQLRIAGFGQREIRSIVGCDINRVSLVLKNMKQPSRRAVPSKTRS